MTVRGRKEGFNVMQASVRLDRNALIIELVCSGVQPGTIKGSLVTCPYHDDKSPSGSIYADADGVWRYKCHDAACGVSGDVFDLRARRTGLSIGAVLDEKEDPKDSFIIEPTATQPESAAVVALELECPQDSEPSTTYNYTNPDTQEVELVVVRDRLSNGKKRFRQGHYDDGVLA